MSAISIPNCRFCASPLRHDFADLGMSPLSNRFLTAAELDQAEVFYPLKARVCESCLLVQLEEFEAPGQIFQDYLYFSSYSVSWLRHASDYVAMITERLGLDTSSQVIELASNDGYLLQYFRERGIPALGIEPAANVAEIARQKGIPTLAEFFGRTLAGRLLKDGVKADLLLGNNVLAHVPDLNDFVAGMQLLLKPTGIITMEFPHLLLLMQQGQFDTIYHEHFSYFSLHTVAKVFAQHGLRIFDVETLSTHGGSIRIHACHAAAEGHPQTPAMLAIVAAEKRLGLHDVAAYLGFSAQVEKCKRELLKFLIELKDKGKTIAGYGAPAKGNTLLNYCGIRQDLLEYTVDMSPHKQGRFLPGTHIPVYHPDKLFETRPDYILILPWNLSEEITLQMNAVREWGCQFVVPIPQVTVLT